MANNYCNTSTFIHIPKEKIEQAQKIVDRVVLELKENDEEWGVGFKATVKDNGVWITDDGEFFDSDHGAVLVEALVNELKIPGIHVCSWAYTCSKPRIDEFGGGAFAVQMGKETVWIDAAFEAARRAKEQQ